MHEDMFFALEALRLMSTEHRECLESRWTLTSKSTWGTQGGQRKRPQHSEQVQKGNIPTTAWCFPVSKRQHELYFIPLLKFFLNSLLANFLSKLLMISLLDKHTMNFSLGILVPLYCIRTTAAKSPLILAMLNSVALQLRATPLLSIC